VDIPAQQQVDAFLPRYDPRQVLDPAEPVSIGAMVGPEAFTEVRYLAYQRMQQALDVIPAARRPGAAPTSGWSARAATAAPSTSAWPVCPACSSAMTTCCTPALGREPGNRFGQGKNVPLIAMAHEIPYVATATVADLRDLEYKAARAMDFHGVRYLHILVPCSLGWGSDPADTIKVARLATESGLFPVFEAQDGQVTGATPIRRLVPVTDYLRLQARYAHLFRPAERTEVIARIQAAADRNIARFGLMADKDILAERAVVPRPDHAERGSGHA
jgi:hypothetical protein